MVQPASSAASVGLLMTSPSALEQAANDAAWVSIGGYSAAGQKARNDDAFAAQIPTIAADKSMKGAVACIADGVSESDRSHLASQLSVTQFISDYYSTPESWSVEASASRVLRALNDWLCAQSRQVHLSAMVTTFSTVILKSKTLHVFHVGDSRIYHLRGNELKQITRDHNVTLSRGRQMLSAALGMDPRLNVDYSRLDAEVGDIVFLATDGVTNAVSAGDLKTHLQEGLLAGANLDALSARLCDLAVERGSDDNVTCGIVRIDDLPVETVDEAHARVQARAIPPVMEVGHTIDGLEVRKVLFSGTRSHLYKVRCLDTGQDYVLKVPSRNFTKDAVYLEAFAREQWVGQRLDHPGLMRVYPRREGSQFLYMLSEYIAGQTLRDWMADNPGPALSQVRTMIEEMVAALRAMHRMGMVHRDLKPENIMLTHAGELKIIDYGTVQVAGMDDIAAVIVEDFAVGSVDYSAPEYVLGSKATAQSDLFSLGVIAYEMLTGRRPDTLSAAQRRKPSLADWGHQRADLVRSDIPQWVSAALEKACAKAPVSRYMVLSEFLADLKAPGAYARRLEQQTALIERNPLAFWKGLSLLLFIATIILAVLLIQQTNT